MAISHGGISGESSNPISEDLAAIYQGGQNFLARMTAFEDAKKRADEALEALQIGNDIQGARAEAQAKTEAAERLHAEARAALDEAKVKADEIMSGGRAEATAVLEAAHRQRDETLADATSTRADAEAYATKLRAEADAAHQEAARVLQTAQESAAEIQSMADAADAAKVAAEKARTEHEAAKALYEQKIAQIKAVMG